MSNVSKRRREGTKTKIKTLGDHKEFLKRVTKTLYYGKLPSLPCLSLPVTELSANLFSEAQRGRSLKRLHVDEAAEISRNACVSPCSLVLALLYLERLKTCNPEYLAKVTPSELFLVSLMVSTKFLQDDGEEDEVFCDEWAASGGLDTRAMKQIERTFLQAIDWRVYISEQAFDNGLSWLEKQVAMKQANQRGWFTYTDIVAASGNLGISDVVKSLTFVCVSLSLSYLTSLAALFTSTLLVTNSLLPILSQNISPISTVPTSVTDVNATLNDTQTFVHPDDSDNLLNHQIILNYVEANKSEVERPTCCPNWDRYYSGFYKKHNKKYWSEVSYENDVENAQVFWWSTTSITNWLYQTSLITPLQKWLDKISELQSYFNTSLGNSSTLNEEYPVSYCQRKTSQVGYRMDYSNKDYVCTNWLTLEKRNTFHISDR